MATMAIPTALEALTPDWLTGALRSVGVIDGARVSSVEQEIVGQGVGILCQLARLTLDYEGDAAGAPRSVIAKLPTQEPSTRQMVALFRFYEREVRFYGEVAGDLAMRTPRCYYRDHDAGSGDFILLLEDLSAHRIGDQLASCSAEDARRAVQELAAMHAAWWNSPRLDELNWMPFVNDPVNKMGLSLYPQAWGPFMERIGHALPESMQRVGERLGPAIGQILDRVAAGPRTLCHGDFRLDNLFFANGDGAGLTVIDWQIASRATGTYDVGYFASQSLTPEVRRSTEMDLLKMYHGILTEEGVTDYSFDQCLTDYRWTLLFCFAYPVMGGGLGDISNERGAALTRAMMERSAAAIRDWNAGELLDQL